MGATTLHLPDYAGLMARARGENFVVAGPWLAKGVRTDLRRIYAFARLVDELGDSYDGDRLAALDHVAAELKEALAAPVSARAHRALGEAVHPAVEGAARTVVQLGLDDTPLFDLIEANRKDQTKARYAHWSELKDYCRLSANPVGRLVLGVFGVATPERIDWSDAVCTGLQIAEHLQDVAEDARAGRIYLPLAEMAEFGVSEEEINRGAHEGTPASAGLRALVAYEAAGARRRLRLGIPLAASLDARSRLTIAAFVAGGLAALDAVAANRFDPFAAPAKPSPARVVVNLGQVLWRARAAESGMEAAQ